jgi:DNA-binding transcriptional LysR family regulator
VDRLTTLQIFAKVADLQSFSRAAEYLRLPRATVTLAVQELESSLGVKLLQRTTRSVRLTNEGRAALVHCRAMIQDMAELESIFQTNAPMLRGKLRVDMTSSVAKDVVIPRLKEFFDLYPQLEIEIVGADRKLDLVRESIDCTIRGDREVDPSLIEVPLGEIRIINVASPAYLKKFGVPKSLSDLKNHRLVKYVPVIGMNPKGFQYFDGAKLHEVKMPGAVTVSAIDAYKMACISGLGICQNPLAGVRQFIRGGDLIEILPNFQAPSWTLKIAYPNQRSVPRKVRAFVEWVTPLLEDHFMQ